MCIFFILYLVLQRLELIIKSLVYAKVCMLNLFVVYSIIEDLNSTKQRLSGLVENLIKSIPGLTMCGYFCEDNELEKYFESTGNGDDITVILNASGGTERLINAIVSNYDVPTIILADSKKNSFASSLEAYAHLNQNYPVKIFYSENDSEKVAEVKSFVVAALAKQKIDDSHFYLVGNPSDWLLTSTDFNGFGSFKTKFTKLEVDELIKEVDKITDDKTIEIITDWKNTYKEILVDDRSLIDSAKVYLALKQIIKKYKTDVISVRCFDLLAHNYTSCMGLSLCNDEGITAGCEGDIPTTFTMMIAQNLSGKAVWMANPSSIDKDKNEILFAHCSVPTSFIENINEAGLTTHMESGLSTALRGPLRKSSVTMMRISKDFKKIIAVTGRITDSDMKDVNLCRTQAVIKIDGNVEKWVDSTFGNHHVIAYGNILPELKYFCDLSDIELIRI